MAGLEDRFLILFVRVSVEIEIKVENRGEAPMRVGQEGTSFS